VINIGNIINLPLQVINEPYQNSKYVSMEKSFSFYLHYFTAYLRGIFISSSTAEFTEYK